MATRSSSSLRNERLQALFRSVTTPRRTAISGVQLRRAVECCDQTEEHHSWFTKPDVTGDLEHPMASGVRSDLDSDLVLIEEVD
jgi:hypothetical protein